MKVLAVSLALIVFTTGALAQPRPSTVRMTCAQARSTVLSRGAVVLSTGPNTYDRFVSSRNYCEINESLESVWAPTADTPQCFIGYRCRSGDLDFFH
jgi:hypothetical protein